MSLTDQLGFVRMASTLEVRAEGDGRRTLRGVFTPFNEWATIDSWEGKFRERTVPGAFKRTISRSWDASKRTGRHSIVVNYNHGIDSQIAQRQLGVIKVLEERAEGPYYEVSLLDTPYNRDYIIPAAEDGLLGASYRFAIPKGGDAWDEDSDDGIPERTISEAAVFEFGPVDHPAFEAATAGVRSMSEYEWWRHLDQNGRDEYAALIRRAHDLGTPAPVGPANREAEPEPVEGPEDDSPPSGHLSAEHEAVEATIARMHALHARLTEKVSDD